MESIIELQDIEFYNDNYQILKKINLTISKNILTTIVGRSGAGKSTLLKIMSGIQVPDSGIVKIHGKNLNDIEDRSVMHIKKKLAFGFQDSALLSNLSIKENLMLPLDSHASHLTRKQKEERIVEILSKIMLENSMNLRPAQCSSGEQKLISIARAIITEPEILFLDEPLASIDATLAKRVIHIIDDIQKQNNTTVIIVTHSPKIIADIGDRIVLIENGEIIIDDCKENVLKLDVQKRPELLNDIFCTDEYCILK